MEEKGIPNILDTLVDRWFTDDFMAGNRAAVDARLKEVIDTPRGGVFFRFSGFTPRPRWEPGCIRSAHPAWC